LQSRDTHGDVSASSSSSFRPYAACAIAAVQKIIEDDILTETKHRMKIGNITIRHL
jgi:hypothetical protein